MGGGSFSSRADAGHALVINVWGSWCAPCREETAALANAANVDIPRGIRFVGVDIEDGRARGTAFVASHRIPYPSIYDPKGHVRSLFRYPVVATPTTYVIDRAGRIASVTYGKLTQPTLQRLIGKADSTSM